MKILPQVMIGTDGGEYNTELISYELVKNRIIYLNGEINGDLAVSIITQLRYLAEKSENDIYLFINSQGGAVSDGYAIYDVIKEISCDVVTVAIGMAASMGALLLAAGAEGKRYATASTEIMIHQPLGGVQGQATDISLVADRIQKTKRKLASFLAEKCDKDYETVIRDMERDYWMSAEQAFEYGLVDHVGFPEIV